MDTFVTTYIKDYKWPYVRSMAVRTEKPYLNLPPHEARRLAIPGCTCNQKIEPKQKILAPENFGKDWCKPGPSAPLLTPVVYYSGQSPPQRDIFKFDKPNAYLKQLYEKYPYLYAIIESAPPDELVRKVQTARHITTYQADYDHIGDGSSKDYNQMVTGAFEVIDPCTKYKQDLIEPVSRYVRPKLITKSLDYRELKKLRESKEAQEMADTSGPVKPGISEYMDSISRIGGIIISEKLLTRKMKK